VPNTEPRPDDRLKPDTSSDGTVGSCGVGALPAACPARTIDQSSSSHFHCATRLIRPSGSSFVGFGNTIDDGVGKGKEAGGETGKR